MTHSRTGPETLHRDDVTASVAAWLTAYPHPDVTASRVAAEVLAGLRHAGGPVEPGEIFPVPLSVDGTGLIAHLRRDAPHRCAGIVRLGPGRFVHGPDNAIFGRWNSLVAVHRSGHCETFAAHGGEIIPGRLADHIGRVRDAVLYGRHFPVQVDLDVSMACPSACSFCFSAGYRAARGHDRLMSAPLLHRLIDEFTAVGVRVVRFDGGGDPLTHPALPEAVRQCARHGLSTAVLTAGDLLAERHFDAFVTAGTYVRVSLNAASDRVRNLLHNTSGARFGVRRVLDTVRELAARRARYWGAEGPVRMPIGATSMIHPANVGETVAIARQARAAGFDHLSMRVVLGAGHRVAFGDEDRARFRDACAEIRRQLCDDSFQVFLPTRDLTDHGYRPGEYFDRCRASVHRALVEVGASAGEAAIVPCGRYRGSGFAGGPESVVFGRLDQDSELARSWMTTHMRSVLDRFPRDCGDCIDRSANLFLLRVEENLRRDPDAQFFPFHRLHATGAADA